MAAYNAARLIGQSIESLLGQTFAGFELIIVDDCSTDDTAATIARYEDPRIRYARNPSNLGVVGTRNRALTMARGEYVAILDADDLSFPTRLAQQVQHLDRMPECCLVGTSLRVWDGGQLGRDRTPAASAAVPLAWLLQIENPLAFSSTMFRRRCLEALGAFLLDEYEYAEDFDLQHRMSEIGRLDCLAVPLTVYRRHSSNTSTLNELRMLAATAAVLRRGYAGLGADTPAALAMLVARHVVAGHGFEALPDQQAVQDLLARLFAMFVARDGPAPEVQRAMAQHTAARVWRPVSVGIAKGRTPAWDAWQSFQAFCRAIGATGAGWPALAMARANAAAPGSLRALVRRNRAKRLQATEAAPEAARVHLYEVAYRPSDFDVDRPPALYIVIDTEAEFDWTGPFARDQTEVSAMAAIVHGQAIFDRYGLRPVYLVDYPVASQPAGYEPLRPILARGGCVIGAHLQPWTTPPGEEEVTAQNSFACNLPPELEARKIATLLAAIERNFGVVPRFYKAGRYGIGPNTVETLARHGIKVDFSVVPGRDLRAEGGPDFSGFRARPYVAERSGILTLPLTRGYTGALHRAGTELDRLLSKPPLHALHGLGLLRRLRLLDRANLTPEGTPAAEQVALARAMLRRGHRTLVMTFHSPSLAPGHTPYVRDPAEAGAFLASLDQVCRTLFEEIGVLPGNPLDLLPERTSDFTPALAVV